MLSRSKTVSSLATEAIRLRAYLMWEADGQPWGQDAHYWHLAHEALAAERDAGRATDPPAADAGSRPEAKPKKVTAKTARAPARPADKTAASGKDAAAKPKKAKIRKV